MLNVTSRSRVDRRTHPCRCLQLAFEKFDDLLLLRRRHHVADVHQRRSEIVAVMDLVVSSVRESTLPDTSTRNIQLEHTSAKFVRLFAICGCFRSVALELNKLGGESKIVNVCRIQSSDLVDVTRNRFEQIGYAAVIGEAVLVCIQLAPVFGVSKRDD